MTIYIALLRGINVGGNNKINMAELARLFETIGLQRVQTYINSGNVLFESQEAEEPLRQQIEQEIESGFGLSIQVVLRTDKQLEQAIAECPYTEDVSPDGKNVNIGFMPETPSREAVDRLIPYKGPDDFRIIGRDIHLLFREGAGLSKLGNSLPKLRVPATMRNWNTVNQLAALANAMKSQEADFF